MKTAMSMFLCLSLLLPTTLYGNSFPEGIKYLGGPGFQDIEEVRDSWDNSLNITDNEITLGFRKNLIPSETFPTTAVTRITYGQATTRRVGKWVAAAILLAPLALVGIFHKSRQHRVLIEWADDQDRARSILMQVHKDHFVGVINDLTFRTGQSIWATADDQEWLFDQGVNAELDLEAAADPEEN